MSASFLAACAQRTSTLLDERRARKVLLLGPACAGKSTLAHFIRDYCSEQLPKQFASQAQADAAMLAFVMALHPRLGAESQARKLLPEIILRIRELVLPAPLPPHCNTTGIEQHTCTLPRSARSFELVDVGGMRNARRKWIHVFDDVDVVVFVIAVSEYDEVLAEDSNTNRLEEALALWDQICNHPSFKASRLCLFLNKCDLLPSKLAKTGHMGEWSLKFKRFVERAAPLGAEYERCLKFV
jgi:GTPase SAR1 family protein